MMSPEVHDVKQQARTPHVSKGRKISRHQQCPKVNYQLKIKGFGQERHNTDRPWTAAQKHCVSGQSKVTLRKLHVVEGCSVLLGIVYTS